MPLAYKLPVLVIEPVRFPIAAYKTPALDKLFAIVVFAVKYPPLCKFNEPLPVIDPKFVLEPEEPDLTFNVPVFAIAPELDNDEFTVTVAEFVNVFPLAILRVFCVIFFALEKLSLIFVVPVPLIAEPNAPVPERFNVPALFIAFVIPRLLAATFTVPLLIVMLP